MSTQQTNPLTQRQADEAALADLALAITVGTPTAEAEWTTLFERLANLYFASDTPALLKLAAATADLPLQTAVARQTRHYFQGVAAFRQDRYEAALTLFDDLLAAPDLPPTLQARALNARAVIYRLTGRLEEAMTGYRASLTLWRRLGDNHYQGIVHLNLGIILYGLRRYDEADQELRQAEQFFQAAGSAVWLRKVQSELGLVQRDLGRWDDALAYFAAYIAQSQAANANEDVGVGEANRGEVLLFKGDLAQAKVALEKALRLLVSRAYRCDHLLHLGLIAQATQDLTAAEQYYRRALAVAQEIDRREILPHVYYHLGDILRRQGEDNAALDCFEQAAAAVQLSRAPLQDEGLKISLLGRWQQVFEALVLHNMALGRPAAAFVWAERARARAFAEGVSDLPRDWADDDLPRQLQAGLRPDEAVFSYFTTGVLEQDAPLLRAIPTANPLREHLLPPARTLLFVLTRDSLTAHDCSLDPNLFAAHSARGFAADRFLQPAVLQRLSRDLLPAVQIGDTGQPATITLIPHGPLHRVPFTALLGTAEDGPTVGYAPSGAILAAQRQRKSRQAPLSGLAVGFNSPGEREEGRQLRFTEAEVRQAAQLLGGEAWTGPEPKKERLRQAAAACGWLHIACHGRFDDADPLGSYLETGAGERLTAREVLAGWRLQAELATLSACETGVSQILRGDEPMGLARAFLLAGARSLLATQWPVDDLATFLLMGRLYQIVREETPTGLSPVLRAALGRAQRWLRRLTLAEARTVLRQVGLSPPPEWADLPEEATPYAQPIYWAGFILMGG